MIDTDNIKMNLVLLDPRLQIRLGIHSSDGVVTHSSLTGTAKGKISYGIVIEVRTITSSTFAPLYFTNLEMMVEIHFSLLVS